MWKDRTVSGVLCWLKLFRCLFPGKVMLSGSRLDVVSLQDLNSCFTHGYFHFRCFKCDHDTFYTNPFSFQGIVFIPYTWETIGSGNDVFYSNIAPPSPPFHKEKWSVMKSFKITSKFQQISGFLLNTLQKYIFFQNILGGQLPPLPLCYLWPCLVMI